MTGKICRHCKTDPRTDFLEIAMLKSGNCRNCTDGRRKKVVKNAPAFWN
jgi:hypothetical protein